MRGYLRSDERNHWYYRGWKWKAFHSTSGTRTTEFSKGRLDWIERQEPSDIYRLSIPDEFL